MNRSSQRRAAPLSEARPATPPSPARSRLSVRHCAKSRRRLTPRASRTAISRRRRSTRANIRLVTLAQAISSTITGNAGHPEQGLSPRARLGPARRS